MARPKAFDRNEALAKAMQAFWAQGFEATSVQDLVEQMGIQRGSLYDTFGDKRSLYLQAIAYYDHTILAQLIHRLQSAPAPRQAIVELFQDMATQVCPQGCFLTNAVIELGAHDAEAAACLVENLQKLESAFTQALIQAQQNGELPQTQDPQALARFLICVFQGMRVLGKLDRESGRLQDVVTIVESVLR